MECNSPEGGCEGVNDNFLKKVTVDGLTMTIELDTAAKEIKLFGDHGAPRMARANTNNITYHFSPTDTYIRAVVIGPTTTLYLNPIIRWDGTAPTQNIFLAQYSFFGTWLMRFRVVITVVLGLLAYRWAASWLLRF